MRPAFNRISDGGNDMYDGGNEVNDFKRYSIYSAYVVMYLSAYYDYWFQHSSLPGLNGREF